MPPRSKRDTVDEAVPRVEPPFALTRFAHVDLRRQRKALLRTAQQAEQTIASGILDMTAVADADSAEIRAALSALGLMVAKVAICPIATLTSRNRLS